MSKINHKLLKKDIISKNFKKLYFFTGDEYFFIKNFSNKIFELILGNYKNNINFFSFDIEILDINKLVNCINMFPINSEKKCILIRCNNLLNANSEVLGTIVSCFSNLPEFCLVIVQDFTPSNLKRNVTYTRFTSEISKISDFCEFKKEKIVCEKQAIIWAKKLGKILSAENSKLICDKCLYNMQLIKDSVENLCISCSENEILSHVIEQKLSNTKDQSNIFDICKSVREKNLKLSLEIINNLLFQNEDPIKIFAVLSMEFIDAFRIKISKDSGKTFDYISKIFNYKGKEFRLKNAEYLCKIYDIKKCINLLMETDMLLKTTSISKRILINETLIKIMT